MTNVFLMPNQECMNNAKEMCDRPNIDCKMETLNDFTESIKKNGVDHYCTMYPDACIRSDDGVVQFPVYILNNTACLDITEPEICNQPPPPSPEPCNDDPTYIQRGERCVNWIGYNCLNAARWDYTKDQTKLLIDACPKSCSLCPPLPPPHPPRPNCTMGTLITSTGQFTPLPPPPPPPPFKVTGPPWSETIKFSGYFTTEGGEDVCHFNYDGEAGYYESSCSPPEFLSSMYVNCELKPNLFVGYNYIDGAPATWESSNLLSAPKRTTQFTYDLDTSFWNRVKGNSDTIEIRCDHPDTCAKWHYGCQRDYLRDYT